MSISDIDLGKFHPKVQEVVKKYGPDNFGYEEWSRIHRGDIRSIELEYLRHVGQVVYQESLDQRNSRSEYSLETAIKTSQEAREIFLLFEELDNGRAPGRLSSIQAWREQLDLYLTFAMR